MKSTGIFNISEVETNLFKLSIWNNITDHTYGMMFLC